jgi:cation diffusion facilitator CzcD-associated flavoprotein CzcO
VNLSGKRVAVIGTGSSGIQSIPLIAEQAAELTVFQRTPNFALPAHNGPQPEDRKAMLESDRAAYREQARLSLAGVPYPQQMEVSWQLSEADRRVRFEKAWAAGDLVHILTQLWADQGVDADGNRLVADLIREKIQTVVKDPETAAALTPQDHPFGAKRPCLDTNYYATYNRPNVTLVNLRQEPIKAITASGITTDKRSFELDVIVFATGFDAMTGALFRIDLRGRDGVPLRDAWAEGARTLLGVQTVGFPNFFTITGPGSPSVLANMVVCAEQHVEWIGDLLTFMREHGHASVEPTVAAQDKWVDEVNRVATGTMYTAPTCNSWYLGDNIPGKVRVFLPYVGGLPTYIDECDRVVAAGYEGFMFA